MRDTDPFDDVRVPVIGQGTWHLGEDAAKRTNEMSAPARGSKLT